VVRVLAVSDVVHEALWADPSPVRGAELILACGDLPFDYLGRLMNVLDAPLVFVPGNHDPDVSGYRTSRGGLTLRAGLPARPPWPSGAVNADGRVVDIAGLRIAGLGGSPRYSPGPNQYTDWQQGWRAQRLTARARLHRLRAGALPPPARAQPRAGPGGPAAGGPAAGGPAAGGPAAGGRPRSGQDRPRLVDVLLTHAPPRGVGDRPDPPHRGFPALVTLTRHLHPALLLHGHVDPGPDLAAAQSLDGTVVLNVTGRRLLDIEPGRGLADAPGTARRNLDQPGTRRRRAS
jgi:hypothetical protein